jgi:hypothetical protein
MNEVKTERYREKRKEIQKGRKNGTRKRKKIRKRKKKKKGT